MISQSIGTIASLAELSSPGWNGDFDPARIFCKKVSPEKALPQPLPLIADDLAFVDEWVGSYHRHGHNQRPRDINCYFCSDVVVSGKGHLYVNDKLVMSDEQMPAYWRKAVAEHGSIDMDIDHQRSLPIRVIKNETLIFSGWGVKVYGHFLIETLLKFMVARHAMGEAFQSVKLLLEKGTPRWFLANLVDVLGCSREQFEFYDPLTEQVQLRKAIIPSLVSFDGWYHPFCNDLIDEITQLADVDCSMVMAHRLFVSRAIFTNPTTMARRCLNELQLAEIAAKEFGFAVVPIETFPWRTQIALFHKAEVIAGEFGSGLHNALFSQGGTRVGSLGIHSLAQSMIGAVRRQENAYLRTAPDGAGNYTVDQDIFRAFLTRLVNR